MTDEQEDKLIRILLRLERAIADIGIEKPGLHEEIDSLGTDFILSRDINEE